MIKRMCGVKNDTYYQFQIFKASKMKQFPDNVIE